MKKVAHLFVAGLIMFALTGTAMAQMNVGFNGAGAKIGFVSPESGIGGTVGFGAVADLGTITKSLYLRADLDFWSKSESAAVSYSELVLGAHVLYYFPMENATFKPYAGGGINFSRSSAKVDLGPYFGGSTSSSSTDIGFDVVGGADYPISPNMTGFVQVKYHADGFDYLGIFGGVIYNLSK